MSAKPKDKHKRHEALIRMVWSGGGVHIHESEDLSRIH